MTQNFHTHQSAEEPIESTPLAGFAVKTLPDGTFISIWAGDIELKASLTPQQSLKLTKMLIAGHGVFIEADRINRFSLATDAS